MPHVMATNTPHRRYRVYFLLLSIGFLIMLIASCNSDPDETVDITQATALPTGEIADDAISAETVITGEEQSLLIWAPSFFIGSDLDEDTENSVLGEVINEFQMENPAVELIVQPKAETGPASLHSYVHSASQVAPQVIPDILLIETQRLWPLVESLNIPPLSPDEIGIHLDTAYPFAQDAVLMQEQVYGIPYAASIIHLVYASEDFQEQLSGAGIPKSWPELLLAETTYLFAATGEDRASSDMLLLQYVGAGGQLSSEGTVGNPEALTALFNFMAGGTESGLFPAQNREMSEDSAVWEEFVVRQMGMVNVRSEQYLGQYGVLPNTGYATIPTRSGLSATIGRVWAFVILTDEPSKRLLALDLIGSLLQPQIHGLWSQNTHRLPTHIDAFSTWGDEQPYYDFLRQQMDIALAVPNGQAFAKLSQQIQSALLSVLDEELTPAEAVNNVLSQE